MATNFPSSQDNFTNPTSTSSLSSPSHSQQHADVNDAVEAIEGALLDGAPLHIDDANERIGVGTTSPNAKLEITSNDAGASEAIRLNNFDASGTASSITSGRGLVLSADFDNNTGANQSFISFETDASEAMRIDSSGNVDVVSGDLRIGGTAVGDPTTFNPNFVTGLTVGTGAGAGVFSAYYLQVNEIVYVSVDFQFQSGSAVTGDLRMVLPITGNTWHVAANLRGAAWDSSAGAFFPLMGRPYNGDEVRIRYMTEYASTPKPIYAQTVSGSAPFSWTTGDRFTFSTWYVKA